MVNLFLPTGKSSLGLHLTQKVVLPTEHRAQSTEHPSLAPGDSNRGEYADPNTGRPVAVPVQRWRAGGEQMEGPAQGGEGRQHNRCSHRGHRPPNSMGGKTLRSRVLAKGISRDQFLQMQCESWYKAVTSCYRSAWDKNKEDSQRTRGTRRRWTHASPKQRPFFLLRMLTGSSTRCKGKLLLELYL